MLISLWYRHYRYWDGYSQRWWRLRVETCQMLFGQRRMPDEAKGQKWPLRRKDWSWANLRENHTKVFSRFKTLLSTAITGLPTSIGGSFQPPPLRLWHFSLPSRNSTAKQLRNQAQRNSVFIRNQWCKSHRRRVLQSTRRFVSGAIAALKSFAPRDEERGAGGGGAEITVWRDVTSFNWCIH